MNRKVFLLALTLLMAFNAFAQQHKYSMKSGIATTVSIMGESSTPGTVYFDNYGGFEANKHTMEIPGLVSYDYYMIVQGKDLWTVTVEGDKVNSKKNKAPLDDLNFLDLTDEVKAKYNVQVLEKESYRGKSCQKYSYEVLENRKTVYWTVWVYKGFVMKSVARKGKKESIVEVTELKENVPIPAVLHSYIQ